MRFIAHSHYTDRYRDNSIFIGDFGAAHRGLLFNKAKISITDAGVTFFLLPIELNVAERLGFVRILHEKLKERFSHGLSAAMCKEVEGLEKAELASFYEGVKKIDTNEKTAIQTLHCGQRFFPANGEKKIADYHIFETMPNSRILQILSPEPHDKRLSEQDWDSYEAELTGIFDDTRAVLDESLKVHDKLLFQPISSCEPTHPKARKAAVLEPFNTPWNEGFAPAH